MLCDARHAGIAVADVIVFEGRNYSKALLKEWAQSFGLALHPCLLCLFWPCASSHCDHRRSTRKHCPRAVKIAPRYVASRNHVAQ